MVDLQICKSTGGTTSVCCMCGDIGFPDKLFRCTKCCNRFQHSYCRNYYDESMLSVTGGTNIGGELLVCDWCLSEEGVHRTLSSTTTSKKQQSGILSSGRISSLPPSTSKKSIGSYKEGRSLPGRGVSTISTNKEQYYSYMDHEQQQEQLIKMKQHDQQHDHRSAEGQSSDTTSSLTSTSDHQQQQDHQKGVVKNSSGTPSPKTPGRRYKFLKDVKC